MCAMHTSPIMGLSSSAGPGLRSTHHSNVYRGLNGLLPYAMYLQFIYMWNLINSSLIKKYKIMTNRVKSKHNISNKYSIDHHKYCIRFIQPTSLSGFWHLPTGFTQDMWHIVYPKEKRKTYNNCLWLCALSLTIQILNEPEMSMSKRNAS